MKPEQQVSKNIPLRVALVIALISLILQVIIEMMTKSNYANHSVINTVQVCVKIGQNLSLVIGMAGTYKLHKQR